MHLAGVPTPCSRPCDALSSFSSNFSIFPDTSNRFSCLLVGGSWFASRVAPAIQLPLVLACPRVLGCVITCPFCVSLNTDYISYMIWCSHPDLRGDAHLLSNIVDFSDDGLLLTTPARDSQASSSLSVPDSTVSESHISLSEAY